MLYPNVFDGVSQHCERAIVVGMKLAAIQINSNMSHGVQFTRIDQIKMMSDILRDIAVDENITRF